MMGPPSVNEDFDITKFNRRRLVAVAGLLIILLRVSIHYFNVPVLSWLEKLPIEAFFVVVALLYIFLGPSPSEIRKYKSHIKSMKYKDGNDKGTDYSYGCLSVRASRNNRYDISVYGMLIFLWILYEVLKLYQPPILNSYWSMPRYILLVALLIVAISFRFMTREDKKSRRKSDIDRN